MIKYCIHMRHSKDPKYLRLALVRYAQEHGIKPATRAFHTTVKTVRKWLRRFKADDPDSLNEHSRAPKHPKRWIRPEQREEAIGLKRKLPTFGAVRIKRDFGLSLSDKALRKIWRKEGLLKQPRKKHKTKQDLRAVKARWKLFQQTDVDTKDLVDIPEFYSALKTLNLPKVQYTAREVVSGVHFLGYGQERSLTLAELFADILIEHLKICGVHFGQSCFQTDNGSEFIGSWNARHDSAFTMTVQNTPGLIHQTIPPAAHTWQADVETVHNIIENEFYCVESFASRADFLHKASAYNLYFNVARKNSSKHHKTPWEIIHERNPSIHPKIAALPALYLDELWRKKLDSKSKRGYDVIPYP